MGGSESGGRPRTWPAALTLFFLAPLIPESVVTYNSPPLLLLTRPQVWLFISAFYGSIALLVREFIRSRPVRWASVLLLGAAAGAINEGIIAGTWYKVQYKGYALVGGVDPAVAIGLTVFHVLYSTVLPIVLVNLVFPQVADRRWLSRGGVTACLVLLILVTAAGFSHQAHRGARVIVLLVVIVLVASAVAMPSATTRRVSAKPVPRLLVIRLGGALGTVAFFAAFAIVPGLVGYAVPTNLIGDWQVVLIAVMCAVFSLAVATGRNWTARTGWGDSQTLAVISGALLPTIMLSLVLPAALRGLEPLVTLPVFGLLIWLARGLCADLSPVCFLRCPRQWR